jgi:radical SAM protein with 4Fe4S-binding SPASM domain
MNQITAILSMLHESAEANSAVRRFRNKPVLEWTLSRLARAASIDAVTVLCWNDQLSEVIPAAEAHRAMVVSKGERQALPGMQAITAARRWADGWRGGLLGTCEFDLGFHPEWAAEIARSNDADAVLLVDPAAGLIDPVLVEGLVEHAQSQPSAELCFSQAAPGLTATLLRRALVDRLTVAKIHPGRLLTYWPDQHGVDPTGKQGCAPVPTPVARSIHHLKLDSHRQIDRVNRATISLNGHLMSTEAEELACRMAGCESADLLPREVVLELNTVRASRCVYAPASHLQIHRSDLSPARAEQLFRELASLDDIRLTLAGVGDPLLCPILFDVIAAARSAGIGAIHVETDLLTTDPAALARLADCGVDVVSVHFPAASAKTYAAVMNLDGFGRVMENIRLLEAEVQRLARGTPLIVPIFTKTSANLAEMEAWYDYWIRRLGHAVIAGPSDFAGQIPDSAVADMAPPQRRPCARLASRMTILCDGRVVSCEQDVLGKQVMGTVGETPIKEIWQERFAAMRTCHQASAWNSKPLCANCREWHRP